METEFCAVLVSQAGRGRTRAGFRHVQEVQLHRAPTKRGAPTNEGPRAKADSDKRFSSQKGFNVLDAGPLE
jgi:hypothetical protein